MTFKKIIALTLMGLAVSGCASVETATRNAPLAAVDIAPQQVSYNVQDIRMTVPKSLKLSEADRYYAGGEIIWREDPRGDRHAQVKTILENALREGVS